MAKKRIQIVFICDGNGNLSKGKVCTRCIAARPFSDFSPSKTHQTGFVSRCKKCTAELKRISDAKSRALQPSKEPLIKLIIVNGEQKKLRKCAKCIEYKEISQFHSNRSKKDGTASVCKSCCNKTNRVKTTITKLLVDHKEVLAKTCSVCTENKPLTEYNNDKRCAGGKQSMCRDCHIRYYQSHKDEILIKQKMYRLKNLAIIKSTKRRYYSLNKEQILAKNKAYRIENYEEWLDYIKKYYQKNKPILRIKGKEYYENNKEHLLSKGKENYENNKDRYIKYKADYYQQNKERLIIKARSYAKVNHEKLLIAKRKWRRDNPHIVKKNHHLHRARKRALPYQLDSDQLVQTWERFDNACALSGKNEEVTLEHFIPINWLHGGTYIGNTYPLNKSLNSSKNDTNPFEWIKRPEVKSKISWSKWIDLVAHLAKLNGLTPQEFKRFVYWCESNKRSFEQVKIDGNKSSLQLWRDSITKDNN